MLALHAAQPAVPPVPVPTEASIIQYGVQCVQPVFDCFLSRFDGNIKDNLKNSVLFFKSAKLWNPSKIHTFAADQIEPSLRNLSFLSSEEIAALLSELPRYIVQAQGFPPDFDEDHELWWRQHRLELPAWYSSLAKVAVFQPSSACVERVFSVVNNLYDEQQGSALQDHLEASVMSSYNNSQRQKMAV